MAYSPKAIANAFLNRAREEGEEIRPLKLQKLVYYAAGYFAGAFREPLLNCSIEAWDYGPVVPDLYREFRDFGGDPITRMATEFSDELDLIEVPIPLEDQRVMKVVDFVWNNYKKFSGLQLSDMTHSDGTPWSLARNARPGVRNVDIPESLLIDYFSPFVKRKEQ